MLSRFIQLCSTVAAKTTHLDSDKRSLSGNLGVRETQTGVKYQQSISWVGLCSTDKDGQGGVISHMPLLHGAEILHCKKEDKARTVQEHNQTVRTLDEGIKQLNNKNNRGSGVPGRVQFVT